MPEPSKISDSRKRTLIRVFLIMIFVLALSARIVPGARTIDDSYITYRYVQNILAGNGFVYNPGEHVLGTTTPFYAILLTLIGFFSGGVEAPFQHISMIVNALADAITCLLLYQLGRHLGSEFAGIGAALVWAIAPYSVTFAIGGLETSVYVLLLVGTAFTHITGRHILTAFLGALMLLTRPDALILLGPIMLDRLWQIFRSNHPTNKSKLLFELLAFLIPTVIWIAFSTWYFGSPIPHSITAKSQAYLLPENSALTRLLQHYSTVFLGQKTFGIPWIWVGFVLYPFLYLIGSREALKASKRSWPFLIYPWLYLITFSIANPLIFRWYLTPPLASLMLIVLIGLERLTTDIGFFITRHRAKTVDQSSLSEPKKGWLTQVIITIFVIILPFLLSLHNWQLQPDHGFSQPAPSMAWYKLELKYQQAAEFLIDEFQAAPAEITLAAGDVGVLGYKTRAKILDTVGLNSPQSIRYYPLPESQHVNAYAISSDLILDEEPDYIVILEVYGRESLLKDQRFQDEYVLIHTITTDIYDSEGMLIFARSSIQ